MLAEAMIACAIIVLIGDRVMRPFYRASHYSMKNSVGYLVRRSSNLMLPQMEALFTEEALTFSQWTVLMALREWGHSTSAELARDICHDAGSLTRILDELEQRDLIARARSETDRRVVSLSMTPQGLALVSTIINLAQSLKLKVVAEGVETEEQSRLLRLLRCDEMQGFLFSKPVPVEMFEAKFLARPRQLSATLT